MQMIALVPGNISVGSPVRIASDGGKLDVSLNYRSCLPGGCLAEAELSKEQIQSFSRPGKTPGQLSPVDSAGKTASLQFSLRGLDQALDAYLKRQEK
jgi:invasion protein IalB